MWNFLRGGATVIPRGTFIPESRVLTLGLAKQILGTLEQSHSVLQQYTMTLLQGPKDPVLPILANTQYNSILLKGENYSIKLKVCEPYTFFYTYYWSYS